MTPGLSADARERSAPTSPGTAPASPGVRLASAATLAKLRRGVLVVSALAIVLQLALFFDPANLAVSAMLLAGNVLGYGYALRQTTLRLYPISSLMVLGYVFSYFTLPPLGQLVSLQPVAHHLYRPVDDLAYGFIGLLALIGAHLLYSKTSVLLALRGTLRRQFYGRLGFFRPPRLAQLWLMGLLGVVAVLAGRQYDEMQSASIIQAVMQASRPFVYLPYLILLLPAWSAARRVPRIHKLGLVAYSVLLLILAVVVNSRGYLLIGFASLGVVYGYLLAVGSMPLPSVRLRNVLLAALALLVVAGPVTELSMAMVLVRGQRADLSPMQLVSATWSTFRQGDVSERFQQIADRMSGNKGVDEAYFDNLFLNRLANLKFLDNAVINQSALSPGEADYFSHIEGQKVWSILPAPLIRLLGLDVDKKFVTSGSSGDFLLYAASGNSFYAIGGFRTGSMLVNLSIVFGWLWPLVLLVLAVLVFAVVDAWCQPVTSAGSLMLTQRFNPLVLSMLFYWTFFFSNSSSVEDMAGLVNLLMRGWLQLGLLYAIAFWLSRIVTSGRRV